MHATVHRQLLVISGPEQWAIAQADTLFGDNAPILWIGNNRELHPNINASQYRQYLGQEFRHVIMNCYSGFRANAAIALSGVIKSGGLMVLICPHLDEWDTYPDPEWKNRVSFGFLAFLTSSGFIRMLRHKLQSDSNIALLTPSDFKGTITPLSITPIDDNNSQITTEQNQAIAAIVNVATGHRNRPLVLSADRGRGKSSALGFAAASLIQHFAKNIFITAPSPATVERVFYHAKNNLLNCKTSKNKLTFSNGSLTYCAIDELLNNEDTADIIFIDEAAALPTQLLTQLIDKFSRIVFSTTLHGYEGSGRGFELRVKKYLNAHKPQWKSVHLHQAMRWYTDDYLEALWFDTFFMQGVTPLRPHLKAQECSFNHVTKQTLLDDLPQARAIFQLLINAHYQTSPDDLVRLFDSPEQHCFVIKQGQDLLGVALIIEEGGEYLSPIKHRIASGNKRVKGHLVAQNIAYHYALADFSELKQWRITRIAIQDNVQNQGLGQQLLNCISQTAMSEQISSLSVSFGINLALYHFWKKAGFTALNLSQKPETSSAEHSVQLISPLSEAANALLLVIQAEFQQELLFQADKSLNKLDAELLGQLLKPYPSVIIENPPPAVVIQFCQGHRPLINCKRQLKAYLMDNFKQAKELNKPQFKLLISALIQNQNNQELADKFKLRGKKEIEETMREAFKALISAGPT